MDLRIDAWNVDDNNHNYNAKHTVNSYHSKTAYVCLENNIIFCCSRIYYFCLNKKCGWLDDHLFLLVIALITYVIVGKY